MSFFLERLTVFSFRYATLTIIYYILSHRIVTDTPEAVVDNFLSRLKALRKSKASCFQNSPAICRKLSELAKYSSFPFEAGVNISSSSSRHEIAFYSGCLVTVFIYSTAFQERALYV